MEYKVKVVVLGTGQMGSGIIKLLLQKYGVDLVGVYGRRTSRVGMDVGKTLGLYTSYKVANMLVEFSTSIPRTQLRPGYGDGFLGAPLHTVVPPAKPSPREQGGRRGTSRPQTQQNPGSAHHV
jgi:hypothetical protein